MRKFAFIGLIFALPALAQTAFDSAVQSIVENNAELHAARSRYLGETEAGKAENLLQGPEAEFEYKFGPRDAGNRWGVSVSQGFDWPGLYGARRKENRYKADAFRQLYVAERTAVTLQARTLLLDYVQARRDVVLLTEAENNLRQLNDYLTKAYEHESTTILVIKKTRRELFNISGRRADAEAAVVRIVENLKAMGDGNIDLSAVAAFPDMPLRPYEDYHVNMMLYDNTLAAKNSLVDAGNASVGVNRAGRMPSFSVGYVHDFEDNTHFNGVSIGIGLPSWGKNHGASAAKANALAALFEKEDYQQGLEAALAADWHEASELALRLTPVKEEFATDNYLELLSKSFYGGQLTVFEYLREINEYIDFRITLTELEHRYTTVVARLDRYNYSISE